MPKINQTGLDLIKSFEGCSLQAYQDGGGVWTIGWGTTGKWIKPGMVITQAQADHFLDVDIAACCGGVNHLTTFALTPNQFSALVSFAYNLGLGALGHSTLLTKLHAHNISGAADEFLKWDHDNGKVVAGLTRRRKAERALFLKA